MHPFPKIFLCRNPPFPKIFRVKVALEGRVFCNMQTYSANGGLSFCFESIGGMFSRIIREISANLRIKTEKSAIVWTFLINFATKLVLLSS